MKLSYPVGHQVFAKVGQDPSEFERVVNFNEIDLKDMTLILDDGTEVNFEGFLKAVMKTMEIVIK